MGFRSSPTRSRGMAEVRRRSRRERLTRPKRGQRACFARTSSSAPSGADLRCGEVSPQAALGTEPQLLVAFAQLSRWRGGDDLAADRIAALLLAHQAMELQRLGGPAQHPDADRFERDVIGAL